MARIILVLGESGSGKSRSTMNLNPEETFMIKVIDKDLPYRGSALKYKVHDKETREGNTIVTHDPKVIINSFGIIESLKKYKNVVIDDTQFIMSYEFFDKAKEKGYEKFTSIGQNMYMIFKAAQACKLENVFFLSHSEDIMTEGERKTKMKTIGKLLDEKLTPEGLFTVVLLTDVTMKDGKPTYEFVTQSDGTTTAKSPEGMFPLRMENDLQLVIDKMNEYYNSIN